MLVSVVIALGQLGGVVDCIARLCMCTAGWQINVTAREDADGVRKSAKCRALVLLTQSGVLAQTYQSLQS